MRRQQVGCGTQSQPSANFPVLVGVCRPQEKSSRRNEGETDHIVRIDPAIVNDGLGVSQKQESVKKTDRHSKPAAKKPESHRSSTPTHKGGKQSPPKNISLGEAGKPTNTPSEAGLIVVGRGVEGAIDGPIGEISMVQGFANIQGEDFVSVPWRSGAEIW